MSHIFISYASRDRFFAELAVSHLAQADIAVWRDQGNLRAGDDWQDEIEAAITRCLGVLVVLSAASSQSSYVTYEWAYALGLRKPLIPVLLENCDVHSRLRNRQRLDFSGNGNYPWQDLIDRIQAIEEPESFDGVPVEITTTDEMEAHANAVLTYLNARGFQMASFERLREKVPDLSDMDDALFQTMINAHSDLFRNATLKGSRPGIAKRVP